MKLDLEKIREITTGAVKVTEENDGFHFYRFTDEQYEMYRQYREDFYRFTYSTPGVHFEFETDGTELVLSGNATAAYSTVYGFDLFVDGKYSDGIYNFSEGVEKVPNYCWNEYPLGSFRKAFSLGKGKKTVKLVFPWSINPILGEIEICGAGYVTAVKKRRKMLAFGDSITHGTCALYPSKTYAERIAGALEAEIMNKAIGGEIFNPKLAVLKDGFKPDFITVAYGTNDWRHRTSRDDYEKCCRGFVSALSEQYTDSQIFVFTPIWRNTAGIESFCEFDEIDGMIEPICRDYKNVICISGRRFVPENSRFFCDEVLHPNDEGFGVYADAALKELGKYL